MLDEDASLVADILEASAIESLFRTAGKDFDGGEMDGPQRRLYNDLLDAAPDRGSRARMLSRHAKLSGE